MYIVENRLANYLLEGYSDDTVQHLLCDLKVYQVMEYDAIASKALAILESINQNIRVSNSERYLIVRVLDTVLWVLTLGFLRLLDAELKIGRLMDTSSKVRDYIITTPLIYQTQRKDYATVLEKQKLFDAKKKALEEELKAADKKSMEQQKAAEAKRQEELQKQIEKEKQRQELLKKQAEEKAAILQKEMDEKKVQWALKGKILTEEQIKIKEIKGEWKDDVQAELVRLKANGKLTQERSKFIKQSYPNKTLQDMVQVIIGRAVEIKAAYPEHYVFFHAQASGMSVINAILKKLIKQFDPVNYNPLSIPFRSLFSVDLTENVDEFVKKYPHIHGDSFNDDKLNVETSELLSVDSYMGNIDSHESALYFLTKNSNINQDAEKIFKGIFTAYCGDDYISGVLAKKANQIVQEKKYASNLGVLYPICIPKEVVKNSKTNFAYRSHGFGRKCRCHLDSQDIEVLEKTQQDIAVICKNTGHHPQYRLLTARLDQEKTVRSFQINALPKVKNKEFNKRIHNLIGEFSFYAKVSTFSGDHFKTEEPALLKELHALSLLNLVDKACLNHLINTSGGKIPDALANALTALGAGIEPLEYFGEGYNPL